MKIAMKYKMGFICLLCVILLVITFGGVVAGKNRAQEDINLTEVNQDTNKDNEYFQYVSRQVASEIKEHYGFSDCDIHVSCPNGEIPSVDVYIPAEDIDNVEADIKDYISECFDIPADYVSVSNVDAKIETTENNDFDGTDSNTETEYILQGECGNEDTMSQIAMEEVTIQLGRRYMGDS